jgi:hypothetical protein
MARSKKKARRAGTSRRSLPRGKSKSVAASTPWPAIEQFLQSEEGSIQLGVIDSVPTLRYTAVASDHHTMLVALVRDKAETLHQLLDRLEAALGPALDDQIFVDEING